MQASPVSGARTTRVELLFNDINYESDAQLLNGERIHLLNVVNHMGHRIAPLLFNWVGDHRLLNNNEEQTIRLRMINTQRNHPLRLSQDKLKPTKIIFETTYKHIQIKQITLVKNGACDQVDFGVKKEPYSLSHDEANHRWTFSEEEWMITEVGKGGCIEFDVCFTPSSNSDTYFLSIHYENIPGYWDNSITLPLLVSPIVFKGNNVGIGMEPEDDATLTVAGDINASGKFKENGHDLMPAGAIIMWSGKKVPEGWILCDGKNNTPNLIDRFIMGGIAKLFDNEDSTRVNGKNKMVLNEKHLPDHKHTFKMKAGPSPQDTLAKVTEWVLQPIKPERKELYHTRTYHTENIAGRLDANNKKIEVSSFDNRPAYYTLAFIMKL